MHIIELTIKNADFYCPFTGEWILKQGAGINEKAKFLAGLWDNDFSYYSTGPVINHERLKSDWDDYMNTLEHSNIGSEERAEPDPDNFLYDYDKDPGLICFKLISPDKPGELIWIVLKVDGDVTVLG